MNKSRLISRTAVFASLNMVFLVLGQIIRTNTLSFLVIASFITAFAVIYTDMKHAVLMYVSTSLLAFIFIPEKSIPLLYVLFFGVYGIIKLYIEKILNQYLQFLFKSGFFLIAFYIAYILVGKLLIDFDSLFDRSGMPAFVFVIMFILLFNIYDFLYTAVIKYCIKRLRIRRD